MSEQNKPFVVTDRRKFTLDGTPASRRRSLARARAPRQLPQPLQPHPRRTPLESKPAHRRRARAACRRAAAARRAELPPPPTASEMEQANAAYQQTSERLDTAVRAANPGMDHPPAMTFDQIVQSIYMTTIMQLGGATQEGQQPKVDLMGARQSIDMLAILAEKTKGNLTSHDSTCSTTPSSKSAWASSKSPRPSPAPPPAASQAPGAPGSQPGRPSIVR